MRKLIALFFLLGQALAVGTTPQHLVIVYKENRSYDEMFGAWIGNGASTAMDSGGNTVNLFHPPSTVNSPDCNHGNIFAIQDINGGLMNKFNLGCTDRCTAGTAPLYTTSCTCPTGHGQCVDTADCGTGGQCTSMAFEQYTKAQLFVSPTSGYAYWASTYYVADNYFESLLGPSFPARQYLATVSTPCGAVDNPAGNWYCGAPHTGSSLPYTYSINFTRSLCASNGNPIATCTAAGQLFYGGVCQAAPTHACSCVTSANTNCNDTANCGSTNSTCMIGTSNPSGPQCIGGTPGCYCTQTCNGVTLTTLWEELENATNAVGGATNPVSWAVYAPAADQGANGVEWNVGGYTQWGYANRWFDNTTCNTPTLACCDPPNWGNTIGGSAPGGGTVTFVGKVVDWHCFIFDTNNGNLPAISWLIANLTNNEHPASSVAVGNAWTANELAPIFNSSTGACTSSSTTLYCTTIIAGTWDDWGGFYDHVPPPTTGAGTDVYGPGIRLPFWLVSPYANNTVDHVQYEAASLAVGIEKSMMTWLGRNQLSTLSARDAAASDILANAVNLSNSPIPAPGGNSSIGTQVSPGNQVTPGNAIQ